MAIPLLFPLVIGGAGLFSGAALGGAAGFTAAEGAKKTGEALKWAVLGGVSLAALAAAIYVSKKR